MRYFYLLVLEILISGATVFAQTDSITEINFSYDDAGNRVAREIVYYEGGLKSAEVTLDEEIEEIEEEKGLNVFPNPVNHSLYVTLNKEAVDEENRMIIVFDNLGRQVIQTTAYQEINQIDVSSLANGTYILKLIYGRKQKEWIIIKN